MGIKTKGRRKLSIANRSFVYYSDTWNLRIASADKKFIVRLVTLFTPWDIYHPKGFTPLEIIGSEFLKPVKLRKQTVDSGNYKQKTNIWVKYPKLLDRIRLNLPFRLESF